MTSATAWPGTCWPSRARRSGDFKSSIKAYEAALALLPDHADIANDLGRLAYRLGQKRLAGQLFAHYHAARPDCQHGCQQPGLRAARPAPIRRRRSRCCSPAIGRQPGRPGACGTPWARWSAAGRPANAADLLRRGAAAGPGLRQGPLQPRQRQARARRLRRRAGRLRGGDAGAPGRPTWR